jgi:hypothetical protein
VLDTGIAQSVSQGRLLKAWHAQQPTYEGGVDPVGHGTMVASAISLAAPHAGLLDFAFGAGGDFQSYLSDVLRAYAVLREFLQQAPGPLVINNSWCVYETAGDFPVGDPGNYGSNPLHGLNRLIGAVAALGADIVFAAGNCGLPCPAPGCGAGDRGPGASIIGANGHPDVTTVAAVTTAGDRLGMSSQGPAKLTEGKPDLAAYSHFQGVAPAVLRPHGGTSAAAGVCSGVVAALRTRISVLAAPPGVLRGVLTATAALGPTGFNHDTGHGVLQPVAAATRLGL